MQERLETVWERVEKAAKRSGRSRQDITLVAVTKSVPLDRILPFLQSGIRHVGENRVQEALSKFGNAQGGKSVDPAVQLHLIGHLQGNKAKKAVGLFDMIQSVDSKEIANDLNRHAEAAGRELPCLIEVKISSDAAKTGLAPEQVEDFLSHASAWPRLRFRGLMGIAPLSATAEEARPYFARLRTLFEKTKLEILSMGMSPDYEVAIEEGATMVRLGTALFGSRS